ncbi:tRNA lysidine(34) synthetase TilS [Corynebacterium sp. 335C]
MTGTDETRGDRPAAPFWPRRSPALLSLRRRIREALPGWPADGAPVTVGVSGGADSLALLAAVAAEARGTRARVLAAIVDHGLQDVSADVASRAAGIARGWGTDAEVRRVDVGAAGGEGPEDAARRARHAALHDMAWAHHDAHAAADDAHAAPAHPVLLLAHTADDQAETVLLSLARGASPAGLGAMAVRRTWDDGVDVVRPLLLPAPPDLRGGARRADTAEACRELGVEPHADAHNADRRYARVRVRRDVVPALAGALGDAAVANLARAADLVRADAEALDAIAADELDRLRLPDGGLPAAPLAALAPAVRGRVIRDWLAGRGAVPAAAHVAAVESLAADPGRGPAAVPAADDAARRPSSRNARGTATRTTETGGESPRRLVVRRSNGTLNTVPG